MERPAEDYPDWAAQAAQLRREGRFAEALTAYEYALALAEDNPITRVGLSRVLSALNRHEEALIAVDHALQLAPTSLEGWIWRGSVLDDLERFEEEIQAYQQALQLTDNASTRANFLHGIGNALWSMGKYSEGLRVLDNAIELDPTDAPAWNNRGNCLSDLGHDQEAMSSYERAIVLTPAYPAAWNNKGNMLRKWKR